MAHYIRKIRDTKGIFHEKMGSIKNRNGMDLTEAEDIKNRWQGYTEELYKRHHHDPDNHNGVITQLELDILECEVKWTLASITMNKASGGDGIPVELFHEGHEPNWNQSEIPKLLSESKEERHSLVVSEVDWLI